jgi:CBS domain-containing protein/Zn-dependent protease
VSVTLRGIRIRATAGWLVTYLLLVATLVLWRGLPDAGVGTAETRLLAIVLVPLVLLPTVVLHELAHLVVARWSGSTSDTIDLRLVGMARGRPTSPAGPMGQARIALAGPVASLLMGAVLLLLARAVETGPAIDPLLGWTLGCVALGDLILGAASLYPGRPMDGADVVHAIAWRVTGSRSRAARVTSVTGVLAGWMVMLTGLFVAARIDTTAGLWVALLGWSLGRVSRNARDQDRLIDLVAGLNVSDAIQRDVAVVVPTLTLDTVLAQHRISEGPGVYPVVRQGALLGILDVRDVGGAGRPGTELRVSDKMRSLERLHVVTEGQRLWDAVAILEGDGVSAVPVVASDDRHRLLGLVTRSSVVRLLRERARRNLARGADAQTGSAP